MKKTAVLIAVAASLGVVLASGYDKGYDRYDTHRGGYNTDSYHGGHHGSHHGHVNWGYWGEWADCTATCGGGSQTRTRECKKPHYQTYGECYGAGSETRACNTQGCPVNGMWSEWESFTECSVSCGGGEKTRARTCTNPAPANGGADCEGDDSETESCNEQGCPVDGVWSEWGDFTECSVSCGGGEKTRARTCTKPAPANGGADCEGDDSETESCNEQGCPVNGAWSEWGTFGDCSVDCGYGTKTRTRTCTNPEPANGGADCEGEDSDSTYCYIYKCPVDGKWSAWSYWTSCSGSCGEGYRVRSRACNYPAAANGGADCAGDKSETETCQHYNKCYHGYQHSSHRVNHHGQGYPRGNH